MRPLTGPFMLLACLPPQGLSAQDAMPASRPCFTLRHAVAAGDYLSAADLAPAPCQTVTAGQPPRLRFDRAARAAMAAAPLAAGAYLGPVLLPHSVPVTKGCAMTLAISAGPVRIERRVEVLQPSREGQQVFVRTAEGAVLSAPLAMLRPESAQP